MRRLPGILSLLLVGSFAAAGCGGKEDPSGMPQDTPERALKKMARALEVGDKQCFLECWEVTLAEEQLLSATMDMIVTRRKLDEAAVEKFGRKAWEASGRKYAMKKRPKNPIGVLKFDSLEVKIEGDEATVTTAGQPPRKLVKRNGVWKVTGADLPQGDKAARVVVLMKGLRAAMASALAEVEKAGTADVVRRKMLAETVKAIMVPAIEAMKERLKEKE